MAKYKPRYGFTEDEMIILNRKWFQINHSGYSVDFESYDAFVKWCKGKFDYGLILERIDTHKEWSPENCRWVKPQYCATSEQLKRQIFAEWERMMQPLRKKYAKELAQIENSKQQYFRYEHPDLVREGIVFANSQSIP